MDLVRLQSNLAGLDVVELAYNILDDMSDFIADLNRERLIKSGKDSEGSDIGDYSELTVTLKDLYGKGFGKITDHVTLYDSGKLHESIFASVINDELIVDATDPKLSGLEDHFNNDQILGLTKKEIDIVHKEFMKRFYPALEAAILR